MNRRFYQILLALLVGLSFALSGCGYEVAEDVLAFSESGELAEAEALPLNTDALVEEFSDMLTLDEAFTIALDQGVSEELVVWADMLPFVVSAEEAMATWGFIEEVEPDVFLVTYIDQYTGDVIELQEEATDNILNFIYETGLDLDDNTKGSSTNSYDSFPWNWRLPMESGSFYLTCGYGCYYHSGSIYYSTDWSNGSTGHLLESPASCWVMYTTYSSSYGYQVLAECGNAGSSKRYYYRVAHMKNAAKVSPGWWIGKGRDLGYIGNTGNSTGAHLHYETVRAKGLSGGSYSSAESLPQTNWPSSSDGLCNGDLNGYNFYGTPNHYIKVQSDGCP